jgi:hypothetical protein
MKNIISFLISLTAILFLFSCGQSKNSNEKDTNSTVKSPLTAKVDGELFQAFELSSYALKVITPTSFQVNIFGIAKNGEKITLKIEKYKGAGTYSIGNGKMNEDNQSVSSTVYIKSDKDKPASMKTWFSEKGEITIFSEVNERLTGSFTFTAKAETEQGETKNISEGVFDIAIKR